MGNGIQPRWVPQRVQMMYLAHGTVAQGLVTAEVYKKPSFMPGKFDVKLLCVDVNKGDGTLETLMVDGDEERLHVRSSLHGFVEFKKDYINQSEEKLRQELR